MKVSGSTIFNAPSATVFELITNLDQLTERVQGIMKIDVLEGPAQMQVGTKWRETRKMYGKEATEVMWVTALEQNSSYVVEAESHGTHYRTTYTLSPVDGGTRVDFTFSGTPISFAAKLLSPMLFFMKGSLRKAMLADLEDLKKVAEQRQ